jgi:hypothetical protein
MTSNVSQIATQVTLSQEEIDKIMEFCHLSNEMSVLSGMDVQNVKNARALQAKKLAAQRTLNASRSALRSAPASAPASALRVAIVAAESEYFIASKIAKDAYEKTRHVVTGDFMCQESWAHRQSVREAAQLLHSC